MGCTSLPMPCLGRELCDRQLLKSNPGLLFCPEDIFLVKGGRDKSSGLHVWRPLECGITLYTAQRCRILLDLSIKEFLAPGQQPGVMDQSVGGRRASAVSGGGGKVWDCHLAKGCR